MRYKPRQLDSLFKIGDLVYDLVYWFVTQGKQRYIGIVTGRADYCGNIAYRVYWIHSKDETIAHHTRLDKV